jgi:hypothetical protein
LSRNATQERPETPHSATACNLTNSEPIEFTARFGRNHADSVANLLVENSYYHLYLVPAALKPRLRTILREKHGIWRGSMFPDSAGAAETAREAFK